MEERDLKNLLVKLNAPSISSPKFAEEFSNWCTAVASNFEIILSAPYLKGDKGNSVVTYKMLPETDDWILLTNAIIAKINEIFGGDCTKDKLLEEGSNSIDELNKHTFTVFKDDYTGKMYLTAPYFFIDARIKDLANVAVSDINFQDKSLTFYGTYENGVWTIEHKELIPTLYYDEEQRQFCWSINGEHTGIIAQGLKGDKGEDVEAVKIVRGYLSGENEGAGDDRVIITQEYAKTIDENDIINTSWEDLSPDYKKNYTQPGDVVLALFKNRDGESEPYTGAIFGIFRYNSGYYVPYYSSMDIVKIISAMKFRDMLNSIGIFATNENSDNASDLRGIYLNGQYPMSGTPAGNDIAHMTWVEKNQSSTVNGSKKVHSSIVNYKDTVTNNEVVDPHTKVNPLYIGSEYHIDYETTFADRVKANKLNTLKIEGNPIIEASQVTTNSISADKAVVNTINSCGETIMTNIFRQTQDIESDFRLAARVQSDATNVHASNVNSIEGVVNLNISLGYIGYGPMLYNGEARTSSNITPIWDPIFVRVCEYPLYVYIDPSIFNAADANTTASGIINYFNKRYKVKTTINKITDRDTGAVKVYVSKLFITDVIDDSIRTEDDEYNLIYADLLNNRPTSTMISNNLLLSYVSVPTSIVYKSFDYLSVDENDLKNVDPDGWTLRRVSSIGNVDENYDYVDLNLDGYYKGIIGTETNVLKSKAEGGGFVVKGNKPFTKYQIKDIKVFPEGIVGYNKQQSVPFLQTYSGLYRNGGMVDDISQRQVVKEPTSVDFLFDTNLVNRSFVMSIVSSSSSSGIEVKDTAFILKYKSGDNIVEARTSNLGFAIDNNHHFRSIRYQNMSGTPITIADLDYLQIQIKTTTPGLPIEGKAFILNVTPSNVMLTNAILRQDKYFIKFSDTTTSNIIISSNLLDGNPDIIGGNGNIDPDVQLLPPITNNSKPKNPGHSSQTTTPQIPTIHKPTDDLGTNTNPRNPNLIVAGPGTASSSLRNPVMTKPANQSRPKPVTVVEEEEEPQEEPIKQVKTTKTAKAAPMMMRTAIKFADDEPKKEPVRQQAAPVQPAATPQMPPQVPQQPVYPQQPVQPVNPNCPSLPNNPACEGCPYFRNCPYIGSHRPLPPAGTCMYNPNPYPTYYR